MRLPRDLSGTELANLLRSYGYETTRQTGSINYRVERAEVAVAIVPAGLRRAGDKRDVYALAKKLLKQGLLR